MGTWGGGFMSKASDAESFVFFSYYKCKEFKWVKVFRLQVTEYRFLPDTYYRNSVKKLTDFGFHIT